MTEFQLKTRKTVDELQEKVVQLTRTDIFTLNLELQKVMEEIDNVRANCDHLYENNKCILCGAKEHE